MGHCGYCKEFVIAGGIRDHGRVYCSRECHYHGRVKANAQQVPEEMVESEVSEIFDGACPICEGPGPIDLHKVHYDWSALLFCRLYTEQVLTCRPCARKRQLRAVLFCGTLGWWSLSGLAITPAQIFLNLQAAFLKEASNEPSKALRRLVSKQIAERVMRKMETDSSE